MLNIEKTNVEAKIYGKKYELKLPTVAQAQKYATFSADLSEEDKGDSLEKMLCLLEECGLPKETTKEMEMGHLLLVVNELMPKEKK